MQTKTLIKTALFGLVLVLGACGETKDAGQGDAKSKAEAPTKAGDAKAGDAKAGEVAAGEAEVPEAPPLDPKVEQAVTLANKISAEPESADQLLEEAGMDREAFERLLYEIARDPELSKSYAIAREA